MNQTRILRLRQVAAVVGLSRASIYRLMEINRFPKPIKIGISAVGWIAEEIERWIDERKHESTTVRSIRLRQSFSYRLPLREAA